MIRKYVLRSTLITLLLTLFCPVSPQDPNKATSLSKRGLLYIGTDHLSDYNIFTSSQSPLTWYYNWSPNPSLSSHSLEFVPMIHGTDSASSDASTIKSMSHVSHVLVFNEPDGSTGSGGSDISPEDAARVYLDTILPLREKHGKKLSLPATTGSPRGLEWLASFNESCHDLAPRTGCPFDFIAAHWYGDFAGMASWLGTLHATYPGYGIWLTEFALPQSDAEAAGLMMNQSLPWLDELEWVERYTWFGAFREDDANEWTGDGVSLLDSDGGLTELGATYLGGQARGFKEGQGKSDSGVSGRRVPSLLAMGGLMVGVTLLRQLPGWG